MGRWVVVVALAMLVGGCGGHDNNDNQATATPTPAASPTPLAACSSLELTYSEESPIDLGFTGFVHRWLMPRGGKVTFPLSDCDCVSDDLCTLGSPTGPKRCTVSYAECESDADCAAEGGKCLVAAIGGPAVPLAGAGVPSCLTLFFEDGSSGTVNLDTGELVANWNLLARAHATQLPNIPCPVCVQSTCSDDPSQPCNTDVDCEAGQCQLPAMGAQGICIGGANDGKPCTVDALSALFGGFSSDCPPGFESFVGSDIHFSFLPVTTATTTLAADLACLGIEGASCPCGVCSDNANRPCRSDADCGGATCQAAQPLPNACEGLMCGPGSACTMGPQSGACRGQQFEFCTDDSGCETGKCEGMAGSPCFSYPIVAEGEREPFSADRADLDLVSAFCLSATAVPTFNQVTGLPGPGFAKLPVSVQIVR